MSKKKPQEHRVPRLSRNTSIKAGKVYNQSKTDCQLKIDGFVEKPTLFFL